MKSRQPNSDRQEDPRRRPELLPPKTPEENKLPSPLAQTNPAQTAAGQVNAFLARSGWLRITQERITTFAEATGDHYFIHTSPERAAIESPFGGTIAHGLLTLSLVPMLWEDVRPPMPDVSLSVNYGFNRVRFVTPVKCNDRIRARFEIRETSQRKPGEQRVCYGVTIEIEGSERPAMIADWQVLYFTNAEVG